MATKQNTKARALKAKATDTLKPSKRDDLICELDSLAGMLGQLAEGAEAKDDSYLCDTFYALRHMVSKIEAGVAELEAADIKASLWEGGAS